MNERDPIILSESIKNIGTVPLPEARENLVRLLDKYQKSGDQVLADATKNALKTNFAIRGERYSETKQ